MGVWIFYAVAIAVILGGGAAVYALLARRGRLMAALAGALTSLALLIFWPIPIHGGFSFLGEALFSEWRDWKWRRVEQVEASAREEFASAVQARFAGELPLSQTGKPIGVWVAVATPDGRQAWLDTESKLVWSDLLPLRSGESLPSLAEAKALCAEYDPRSYWALPTEAEQYTFWRDEGVATLPGRAPSAVAYIVDSQMQLELPTYSVRGASNAGGSTRQTLYVRCVARGPGAPLRGYIKDDIPLELWNTYQVAKAAGL